MSTVVSGIVTNGVVVPASSLPEGANVEIHVSPSACERGEPARILSRSELRKLPPEERDKFLAVAAALAEKDYRDDKELTGFEAFSEEMDDDGEPEEG